MHHRSLSWILTYLALTPAILIAWASAADASTVSIPAGVEFHVKLIDAVSTETSSAGDNFRGVLDIDLPVDQRRIAPAGKAKARIPS